MRIIFTAIKTLYLIITLGTLLILGFILTDRYVGLRKPSENLLENKTPGKYYLEDFFSFQKSVDLGNGFYAYPTMDTSQGILTRAAEIEPKFKIFSWLCMAECSGPEEKNPIIFENKAYSINYVDTFEGIENKFVDIFDLSTGKIYFDMPFYAVPQPIQLLNDRQIYGIDSLPDGMERIDNDWITNSKLPIKIIRIGNSCIALGALIYTVQFLFGGLYLVLLYLNKSYSKT